MHRVGTVNPIYQGPVSQRSAESRPAWSANHSARHASPLLRSQPRRVSASEQEQDGPAFIYELEAKSGP